MNCCQCQGIEDLFNEQNVARELKEYRSKGSNTTTQILVREIKKGGVEDLSLLDVGGGVGAIQHELLAAGVQSATDVDASHAYLHAAQKEAQRRGVGDRVQFLHGNFVEIAAQVSPADIVTLDRVLCCYPDMELLVQLSASRARKLYGLVYPRDVWWVKIGLRLANFFFRLRNNPFRIFAHPTQTVEALVQKNGLKKTFSHYTFFWQVAVFSRSG
jgi:magnesium-protoporphyrin O-methyltransferase